MQPEDKLKKKYPYVYERFLKGEAGIGELRFIIDNVDQIKEDKPKYVVLKEHNIEMVEKDGTHVYKNK